MGTMILGGLLAPFSIFEGLNKQEKDFILEYAITKIYLADEQIVVEGTEGQEIFLILSGEVVVTKKSPIGEEIFLANLKKGNLFGEMGFILGTQRSATVRAKLDTEILIINCRELINNHQEIAKVVNQKLLANLSKILSQKIYYQNHHLARNKIVNVETSTKVKIPSSILVMLGWRWKDITREVVFLSRHGFDAIKISPPQEFVYIDGAPWWAVYQPVSYNFSSYYGTIEDFIEMIDFCHSYNLKVYVDLVINHMAEFRVDQKINQGTNGTHFGLYYYGPLNEDGDYFTYDDFYHFKEGGNQHIKNEDYGNFEGIWRLEHYDFLNLPKLDLTKSHVRKVIRKYIRKLLSLGVDGFRLDAAKHLVMNEVERIFKNLRTKDNYRPYIYQEYYVGSPMGMDLYSFMEKYFRVGGVTTFKYGEFLADALRGKNNNLQKLVNYSFGSSWIHYPEDRAVTVIDNHDTERMMDNMLNFNSPNNSYVLAYIFMLAWPFGIPKIMSSFRFKGHDDPYPSKPVWDGDRNTCFDHGSLWVGQHRWNAIANMVLFHKLMVSATGIVNVWTNGNQVAFARAKEYVKKAIVVRGFVIINATNERLMRKFNTGLPEGKYFNLVVSSLNGDKMDGQIITIENYGQAVIEVPPYDAVVISVDFLKE